MRYHIKYGLSLKKLLYLLNGCDKSLQIENNGEGKSWRLGNIARWVGEHQKLHVIGEQEEGKLVLIWRPTLASISSCIKKSGHFLSHTKDQPPTLCWNPLSIASLAAGPYRNYTVEEWLPSV